MAQVTGGASTRLTRGVLAAALTPMDDAGEPDVAKLAAHCNALIAAGCSGVVLLGTTGEANSFALEERKRIVAGVLGAGVPEERLIVGTGCCAVEDTVALSKHALSLGVRRVLVLPPFYYKSVTDEGLRSAFARIIERTGDDRLRIYLYRIPQMSGVDISVELIQSLRDAYGTVVAGIKDSSGAWESTEGLCRRFGGTMDVLVGNETLLVRGLAAGAAGCVSAAANINAATIAEVAREPGDPRTQQLETKLAATRKALESFGMIPALKAYLSHATRDRSWRNVRPPFVPLSDVKRAELMARVSAFTGD